MVKPEESLSVVAEKYYGDKEYWKLLWNDNATIGDPNVVKKGTLLKLRTTKPSIPDELEATLAARLKDQAKSTKTC